MWRNLTITGTVSVIMGLVTLALRSGTPSTAEPTMEDPVAAQSPSAAPMSNGSSGTRPPTTKQQPQAQTSPSSPGQSGGGMTGGGAMGGQGGGMMCPCMQMMMGGKMSGGPMGESTGQSDQAQAISNPRTKEQARELAQEHLKSLGNPNLKLGEVNETAASFEVQVVTADGAPVNWIIIDKQNGELKTLY